MQPGERLRQLRLLGHGPAAAGQGGRLLQPDGGGGGQRARRAQVAVLHRLLLRGRVPPPVQRRRRTTSSRPSTTAAAACSASTTNACADADGDSGDGKQGRTEGTYMALAEVFEAIAGPDAPVEFQAYDGSSGGRPRLAGQDHRQVADRRLLPGAGAGRARPGPRLRLRPPGRRRRHVHRAVPAVARPRRSNISWADRLKLLQALGGPKVLLPRIPPPPQEVRP